MEVERNRQEIEEIIALYPAHWETMQGEVSIGLLRWNNQLDPSIKGDQWLEPEIENVFRLQDELGNKWTQIAKELTGRTDNNVKNFFYSSLRRALRRVNQYVAEFKKKSNIKPFKPTLITKILSICDPESRVRLSVKDEAAIEIAQGRVCLIQKSRRC